MGAEDLKDIDAIFTDGQRIDEAVREARRQVVLQHRRAGQPLIVWRDGSVCLVDPNDVDQANEAA